MNLKPGMTTFIFIFEVKLIYCDTLNKIVFKKQIYQNGNEIG